MEKAPARPQQGRAISKPEEIERVVLERREHERAAGNLVVLKRCAPAQRLEARCGIEGGIMQPFTRTVLALFRIGPQPPHSELRNPLGVRGSWHQTLAKTGRAVEHNRHARRVRERILIGLG
jgi:hypothetical protein